MWFLWFGLFAQADDWVVGISQPHALESGGTWSRPFSTPIGWKIFLGGTSMRVADLLRDEDGGWYLENRRVISDREEFSFNDHAVKKCSDGSYLHVASRDSNEWNDSAHVWRYSPELEIVSSMVLEEASATRQYNDASILCSSSIQGVAASLRGRPTDYGNDFLYIDANGEISEIRELADYPRMNGGGLMVDEAEGKIFGVGMEHGRPLHINSYDLDWNLLEEKEVDLLDSPMRAYWPQGMIRIGDYYVLAFMGRDDSWGQPGGDMGDVYTAIFDLEWHLQKTYRITNYESNAAMRPWITRDGDTALVAYDAFLEHHVVELRLNLSAFGLDEGAVDTGVDPTLLDSGGCSCSTPVGSRFKGWIAMLLGVWFWGRRESSDVERP